MAHTSFGPQEGLLKGMKTAKFEWTDRTWNPVTGLWNRAEIVEQSAGACFVFSA
jgi:protein gp37